MADVDERSRMTTWSAADAAGRWTEAMLYGLATGTYVVAGLVWKLLLNWIIGPVWIVTAVWIGGAVDGRLRHRRRV